MKQFLLFCSLFWLANAQFSVAPEFKDLLPDELTDFLDKMSSEDEERFLDGKDADSELFDQLATVYKKVQEKLNKLNPDVRSFINNMLSDIYETEDSDDLLVLKTAAKGILKRWKGLTEKDRVEIQKAYPRIYRILSGKSFGAFAN